MGPVTDHSKQGNFFPEASVNFLFISGLLINGTLLQNMINVYMQLSAALSSDFFFFSLNKVMEIRMQKNTSENLLIYPDLSNYRVFAQ